MAAFNASHSQCRGLAGWWLNGREDITGRWSHSVVGPLRTTGSASGILAARYSNSSFTEVVNSLSWFANRQEMSWMFWCLRISTNTTNSMSADSGGGNRWNLLWFSDNNVYFRAAGTSISSTSAITQTGWHHISGTYSRNSHRIYFNGNLIASGAGHATDGSAASQNINLGRFSNSADSDNNAGYDYRLYDRQLTQDEIKDIYHDGLAPTRINRRFYGASDSVPPTTNRRRRMLIRGR